MANHRQGVNLDQTVMVLVVLVRAGESGVQQRDEIQKCVEGLTPAATTSATGQLVVGTLNLGARNGPSASQPASRQSRPPANQPALEPWFSRRIAVGSQSPVEHRNVSTRTPSVESFRSVSVSFATPLF